ncbi:ATP/GTP-binding protein [Chloroflexota bacterium]
MIISTINYSQNLGKADEWHLKGISFGKLNLIVGRNAVGKTRTTNIINALAIMLSGRIPKLLDGTWDIVFQHDHSLLQYKLKIEKPKVIYEELSQDGKILLKRHSDTSWYLVEGEGKKKYHPPEDKLTVQVRRDKKELPYLEELIGWAERYNSISFSNVRPTDLLARLPSPFGQAGPDLVADSLGMAPYLLDKVQNNEVIKARIIKDLAYIGYKIKDLKSVISSIPSVPSFQGDIRIIQVAETGIDFPINQLALSQGMFRVIAIMVTINYLMQKGAEGTIVIDDIGEGLDFERSSKLTELIFRKVKSTGIQLITTSNDRFLMNAVDIKYWNVFERKGKSVRAFNYKNSKEAFDEFVQTGLNNFDFFADRMYRAKKHG